MKKQSIFLIATMVFTLLSAQLFSQAVLAPTFQRCLVEILGEDYFDFEAGESMSVHFFHDGGFNYVDYTPGLVTDNWYGFNSSASASLWRIGALGTAIDGNNTYRLRVVDIEETGDLSTIIYARWVGHSIIVDPNPID